MEKQKKLIDDNIVSIKSISENSLYVFTGLHHLMSNRGSVYIITNIDSKPKVEKITLLPQAPNIVIQDSREKRFIRFLIIASGGISTIKYIKHNLYPDGYTTLGVPSTTMFWSILYPNSAVQVDDKIIIGMRGGVAVIEEKYNLIKKVHFYTKNEI